MFTNILLGLLLTTTTLASPLTPRDLITAETLISDIGAIDTGVLALTASLQTYNGSLLSETPIFADITAIHISNRKGYADANLRTTPFSASDSETIVEFTAESVGVDIPASVDVLVGKIAEFEGQESVILAGLELLKSDHDSFSAALLVKLTADLEDGEAAVEKIDEALQRGIDAYSS